VLLAARTPPARWAVRLPDLASRLRAVTPVEIKPPEDSLRCALLLRLLADRQLAVRADLQDWLLLRLPRSPAALREAVARLDRAALAAGGTVTRTIAAGVLADMGEVPSE
jgi:chromosomal replication initiation ATPase DnaA